MGLVPRVMVLERVVAVPMVWVTVGVKVPSVRSVPPLGQCVVYRVLLLVL